MLTLAAMMGSAVECRAVSDREMEEARAIAAKAYLRSVSYTHLTLPTT